MNLRAVRLVRCTTECVPGKDFYWVPTYAGGVFHTELRPSCLVCGCVSKGEAGEQARPGLMEEHR